MFWDFQDRFNRSMTAERKYLRKSEGKWNWLHEVWIVFRASL